MEEMDFQRKLVAIKMHFGEPGNLTFLRPNYAKVVADMVKELGGVPFLTDCNTLYAGRRKNACLLYTSCTGPTTALPSSIRCLCAGTRPRRRTSSPPPSRPPYSPWRRAAPSFARCV